MGKNNIPDDISLTGSLSTLGSCMLSISSKSFYILNQTTYSGTSNTSSLSKDDDVVMEKLTSIQQLIGTMIMQLDGPTYSYIGLDIGPKKKKVSSCPPLGTITTFCSIFVIMAHDVVLFMTRENISKNHGNVLPQSNWPPVNWFYSWI